MVKLSKKAMRIAIAKDVLKQIRLKALIPRQGIYFRPGVTLSSASVTDSIDL